MANLPRFDPAQAPAVSSQLNLQSQSDAQSWMSQAQERDIQQQQNARQQEIFQAMLPAFQAKSQADTLAAQNDIASATAQQNVRGQWQSLKPQVISDLAALEDPANQPKEPDGTPDWNAKYQQYESLQAKYGALSLLPEGKQYYDMIEQGKKNAFEATISHNNAQMLINRTVLGAQLSGQNQQALAATTAALKPGTAQAEANNTMRNKAFTDIAGQRDALGQAAFSIQNLGQDLQKEQQSMLGSGPFVGGGVMSSIRAGLGDPSAQQVESDMGDFSNRIMSSVKNIRNRFEFNAVTSMIPKPGDTAAVQQEKLRKLDQVNVVLTNRNELMEKLLRSNPDMTPDEADQKATQEDPFPSALIGGGQSNGAGQPPSPPPLLARPASASGQSSPATGGGIVTPQFKAGDVARDAKGKQATFRGGDPKDPANWAEQ